MTRYLFVFCLILSLANSLWGDDFFINPLNEDIPPFKLEEVTTNVSVSPNNGIQSFGISFVITNEKGNAVFRENRYCAVEDFQEYFITEDSLFFTRIPAFEWNGYYDNRDEIVPDGKYILTLRFKNRDNEGALRDKSGKVISVADSFVINVKTKPPEFAINVVTVPSTSVDSAANTEKIVVSALTEKNDERYFAEASRWFVTIKNSETGIPVIPQIEYNAAEWNETSIALPYMEFNTEELIGDFNISILAIDNVLNQSSQETLIHFDKNALVLPLENDTARETLPIDNTEKILADVVTIQPIPVIGRQGISVMNGTITLLKGVNVSTLKIYDDSGALINDLSIPEDDLSQTTIKFEWDGKNTEGIFAAGSGKKYDLVVEYADGTSLTETFSAGIVNLKDIISIQPNPLIDRQSNIPVMSGNITLLKGVRVSTLKIYDDSGILISELLMPEDDLPQTMIEFEWDGKNTEGIFLAGSGKKYDLVVEYIDGTSLSETFSAGIIYQEKDGKEEVVIPDIVFPANQSSFISNHDFLGFNYTTMNTIASLIKQHIGLLEYVRIEGYANPTTWPDTKRMERENEGVLKSLSLSRAETVKSLLILFGVPGDILLTEGKGGLEWVVAPDNRELNHQNRRIKFILGLKVE